jgi:hypothetical protein
MVHALSEAWRVLEPEGLLIDLRPAMVHRRVGVDGGGRFRLAGVARETFETEAASNEAMARGIGDGLFRLERHVRVPCSRKMDGLAEFREWLEGFVRLENLPSHDWLFARVASVWSASRGRRRIVVSAPLDLNVLRRAGPRGRS